MTNHNTESSRPVEPDNAHQTTHPVTITAPDMEKTHYGIPVCHIGEDGESLLALGHHTVRRVIAAWNRHDRTFVGLSGLFDEPTLTVADVLPDIHTVWAIFRTPNPANSWENPECPWVAEWATEDAPGAVPVMWLDGR